MDAFFKGILEPSGRDIFDHLTRMEMPSVNTFKSSLAERQKKPKDNQPWVPRFHGVSVSWIPENALPSVNMGLPNHLIEHHHPWPAYITHTAPVVKMFVEQDELRKTISVHTVGGKKSGVPPEMDLTEKTQVPSQLSGSSCSDEIAKDSVGKAKSNVESSLLSQSICNRVIFARKPPLRVLPCSSFLSSSKRKSSIHS